MAEQFTTVAQLRPGTKGHNLVVRVVAELVEAAHERADGSTVRCAEVSVADSTAKINLTLRNSQVELGHKGEVLVLRNARVEMFQKAWPRLVVDEWGSLERAAPERAAALRVPADGPAVDLSLTEFQQLEASH
eukprot:m51a1_g9458 hypothetical protein (133) ;mRNA; f:511921-512441